MNPLAFLGLLMYAMFLYWCTTCLVVSIVALLFWGAAALIRRVHRRR